MARWTIGNKRSYGPARETLDDAERDRLAGPELVPETSAPLRAQNDPSNLLVGQFAYKCMNGGYGRSLKAKTFETNELYRRVHLNTSPLAEMRLQDVRPTDIEDWVSGIRSRKTKKVDGKLVTTEHMPAPATIRRIYAFVAKIFAIAVRDDIIDRTPCRSIRLPEIKERENRILSPEESAALTEPETVIDVGLVLGISGFSRSEVLALKWSDIREEEKLIRVPGEKNIHRNRVIPLTDWILDALSILDRSTEYVISNRKGGQFDERAFTRQAKARMMALGLPKETRFQDLRGTFITQLLELKTNVKTVMKLVGHSKVDTTTRHYARPRNEVAAEAMSDMIAEIMAKKPADKGSRQTGKG